MYDDKLKSSLYAAYFVLKLKNRTTIVYFDKKRKKNQSYCADVILLVYQRNFNKKILLMIVGSRFYQWSMLNKEY